MTEISRPYDGNAILGDDGPFSAEQWQSVWHSFFGNDDAASSNKAGNNRGVIKGALLELRVQEQNTPDVTVRVRPGYGNVHGAWYHNSADETVTPDANASGSTRIDVVVLANDFTTNETRIDLVKGTPAAGYPSLTQTAGTLWQTPLAALVLASGFSSIVDSDIVDMRGYTNVPDSLFIWVQNNSASVMEGGDIAVWDDTIDSSVTVSTTPGAPIAGVVEGRIPVNGWGRVQRAGIAWVNVSDNVARGDFLSQGLSERLAGNYGGSTFGRALAAGSANEQALALIDVRDRYEWREGDFKFTGRPIDDGWLYADGKTIGNASSGGTILADERSLSLFFELWADYTDAALAIQDSAGNPSTRGASAMADWNANKRMSLPDFRGRAAIARDNQGGTDAGVIDDANAEVTGGEFGSQTHTLTQAELPEVDILAGPTGSTGTGHLVDAIGGPTDTVLNANALNFGGGAHANVQPGLAAFWQIKL